MDKKLKKELIAKRNIIKQKLQLLKLNELHQNNIFLPITKHLRNIEGKLETKNVNHHHHLVKITGDDDNNDDYDNYDDDDLKKKKKGTRKRMAKTKILKDEYNMEYDNNNDDGDNNNDVEMLELPSASTPKKTYNTSKRNVSNLMRSNLKRKIVENFDSDEDYGTPLNKNRRERMFQESFTDYLSQYDELPRRYIHEMITNDNHEFDHKYGVRHNPTVEKFYIGDSQLIIEGSDIIVKNKKYKGTEGLYELIFKKYPKNFTDSDSKMYKEIILETNAHRRHYQPSKQVDGSKLAKYKNIIAPMVTTGYGMLMKTTDNKIDYVHWDDPNELVERLRLLLASQEAGHTGHINEINSIIEELREANIIE